MSVSTATTRTPSGIVAVTTLSQTVAGLSLSSGADVVPPISFISTCFYCKRSDVMLAYNSRCEARCEECNQAQVAIDALKVALHAK